MYDKLIENLKDKDANGVYNCTAGYMNTLIKKGYATIIKRKDPTVEYPSICNEVLDVILSKQDLSKTTVYYSIHCNNAS